MRGFRQAIAPIAIVAGPACLLIVVEPDLGTTLVVAFTVAALLIAAGHAAALPRDRSLGDRRRGVVLLFVLVAALPARAADLVPAPVVDEVDAPASRRSRARSRSAPAACSASGSATSVQKIFYLPEAQTDFILGGDRRGARRRSGSSASSCLYGMIAYAGLRTARRPPGGMRSCWRPGLTSLILCQGILNIFVVLGLAPLTGVPLPFISYAPTNLCVMLAAVGLLLNIARPRREAARLDGAVGRTPRA